MIEKRISLLCAKTNRKLSALARISYYLTFHQKRKLIKAFFDSQFRFCSLNWMFHSRKSNNEINLLHERALWMIYNDQISLFQELFDKDISFTVRHFNIQSLAIEMFQVINNIAAAIIDDYLPHIIATTFTQNLSLLFQVCVRSITIKILYSIMVPISGI